MLIVSNLLWLIKTRKSQSILTKNSAKEMLRSTLRNLENLSVHCQRSLDETSTQWQSTMERILLAVETETFWYMCNNLTSTSIEVGIMVQSSRKHSFMRLHTHPLMAISMANKSGTMQWQLMGSTYQTMQDNTHIVKTSLRPTSSGLLQDVEKRHLHLRN